jgi:hypothetical protein
VQKILFHLTRARNVENILIEGIVPVKTPGVSVEMYFERNKKKRPWVF